MPSIYILYSLGHKKIKLCTCILSKIAVIFTITEFKIMNNVKKSRKRARSRKNPVFEAFARPVKLPFKFAKWS
jgi:hypothetical protein